jgi:hypothetical protein
MGFDRLDGVLKTDHNARILARFLPSSLAKVPGRA